MLSGNVIDSRLVHPQKAYIFTFCNFDGKVISSNLTQSLKALSSIIFSSLPFSNLTSFRFSHDLNAPNPIYSTLLGISTVSSIFDSEKTSPTISFVPS